MKKWGNDFNKVYEILILLCLHGIQSVIILLFFCDIVAQFYLGSIKYVVLSLLILICQRKVILGCRSST